MKEKVQNKYYKRVSAVLKSKLNGQKCHKCNQYMGCSNGSVWGWNIGDSDKTDSKTQKIFNMHKGLHRRSSFYRLYVPSVQGGRELLNVKGCV